MDSDSDFDSDGLGDIEVEVGRSEGLRGGSKIVMWLFGLMLFGFEFMVKS